MMCTVVPFIIKALFFSSTATVPLKSPWTESILSKEALFSKTVLSISPLVTIARSLIWVPLPALFMSSRANKRPIRPKP